MSGHSRRRFDINREDEWRARPPRLCVSLGVHVFKQAFNIIHLSLSLSLLRLDSSSTPFRASSSLCDRSRPIRAVPISTRAYSLRERNVGRKRKESKEETRTCFLPDGNLYELCRSPSSFPFGYSRHFPNPCVGSWNKFDGTTSKYIHSRWLERCR